jgi:hypothetical protein
MHVSPLPWMVAPLLLVATPVLIYGFTQADRLVRAEREFHPVEWERDGSPCGFFAWIIPFCSGATTLSGCRTSVPWRWMFRTPPWVAASREYRKWLRRYRICALLWNLVSASIFIFIMFSLRSGHSV